MLDKKVNSDKKHNIFKFLLTIIISTCVTPEPPKGKEGTDKSPPKFIENKCYPNNSTNQFKFKGKKLIFYFDKEVKLNNPEEEIRFSPSLKKDKSKYGFSYRLVRNCKLIIKLDHKLSPNTVYRINFGKAISSMHENIINENLNITFTTGSNLDSEFIQGTVFNIANGSPLSNIFVSLYKAKKNKNIFNAEFDYFIKTDSQGNFKINHIKNDKYILYASDEINFERDSSNPEQTNLKIKVIAYMKYPKLKTNIRMHALVQNFDKLDIEKYSLKDGIYVIEFNKPIKQYQISIKDRFKTKSVNSTNKHNIYNIAHIIENKQTIKDNPEEEKKKNSEKKTKIGIINNSLFEEKQQVIKLFNWLYNPLSGDVQQMLEEDQPITVIIEAKDYIGNTIIKEIKVSFGKSKLTLENIKIYDTLPLHTVEINDEDQVTKRLIYESLNEYEDKEGTKAHKAKADMLAKMEEEKIIENLKYINKNCKIRLNTNLPIKKLDISKIYFIDINNKKITLTNKDISHKKYHNIIEINKKFQKTTNSILLLRLEKGFITSIDNQKSPSFQKGYIVKNKENTGIIYGNYALNLVNSIVQLLDKRFNIIDKIRNFGNIDKKTQQYKFKLVPPGEYTIRILSVKPNETQWSPGNIRHLIKPNPIYLYHTDPKNNFVKIVPGLTRKLRTFALK